MSRPFAVLPERYFTGSQHGSGDWTTTDDSSVETPPVPRKISIRHKKKRKDRKSRHRECSETEDGGETALSTISESECYSLDDTTDTSSSDGSPRYQELSSADEKISPYAKTKASAVHSRDSRNQKNMLSVVEKRTRGSTKPKPKQKQEGSVDTEGSSTGRETEYEYLLSDQTSSGVNSDETVLGDKIKTSNHGNVSQGNWTLHSQSETQVLATRQEELCGKEDNNAQCEGPRSHAQISFCGDSAVVNFTSAEELVKDGESESGKQSLETITVSLNYTCDSTVGTLDDGDMEQRRKYVGTLNSSTGGKDKLMSSKSAGQNNDETDRNPKRFDSTVASDDGSTDRGEETNPFASEDKHERRHAKRAMRETFPVDDKLSRFGEEVTLPSTYNRQTEEGNSPFENFWEHHGRSKSYEAVPSSLNEPSKKSSGGPSEQVERSQSEGTLPQSTSDFPFLKLSPAAFFFGKKEWDGIGKNHDTSHTKGAKNSSKEDDALYIKPQNKNHIDTSSRARKKDAPTLDSLQVSESDGTSDSLVLSQSDNEATEPQDIPDDSRRNLKQLLTDAFRASSDLSEVSGKVTKKHNPNSCKSGVGVTSLSNNERNKSLISDKPPKSLGEDSLLRSSGTVGAEDSLRAVSTTSIAHDKHREIGDNDESEAQEKDSENVSNQKIVTSLQLVRGFAAARHAERSKSEGQNPGLPPKSGQKLNQEPRMSFVSDTSNDSSSRPSRGLYHKLHAGSTVPDVSYDASSERSSAVASSGGVGARKKNQRQLLTKLILKAKELSPNQEKKKQQDTEEAPSATIEEQLNATAAKGDMLLPFPASDEESSRRRDETLGQEDLVDNAGEEDLQDCMPDKHAMGLASATENQVNKKDRPPLHSTTLEMDMVIGAQTRKVHDETASSELAICGTSSWEESSKDSEDGEGDDSDSDSEDKVELIRRPKPQEPSHSDLPEGNEDTSKNQMHESQSSSFRSSASLNLLRIGSPGQRVPSWGDGSTTETEMIVSVNDQSTATPVTMNLTPTHSLLSKTHDSVSHSPPGTISVKSSSNGDETSLSEKKQGLKKQKGTFIRESLWSSTLSRLEKIMPREKQDETAEDSQCEKTSSVHDSDSETTSLKNSEPTIASTVITRLSGWASRARGNSGDATPSVDDSVEGAVSETCASLKYTGYTDFEAGSAHSSLASSMQGKFLDDEPPEEEKSNVRWQKIALGRITLNVPTPVFIERYAKQDPRRCMTLLIMIMISGIVLLSIAIAAEARKHKMNTPQVPFPGNETDGELSILVSEESDRYKRIRTVLQDISGDIYGTHAAQAAFEWLLLSDPLQLDTANETLVQRYILAVLYFSSNGEGWKQCSRESVQSNTTCSRTAYPYLSGVNECNWYGVQCLGRDVVSIDLRENNLAGEIPSEVSSLRRLRHLLLSRNSIRGTIPTSFSDMPKLRTLLVGDNNLVGTFPTGLAGLPRLKTLSLGGNLLGGRLPPDAFTDDCSLSLLDLGRNLFSGWIPNDLFRCSMLKQVSLEENSFSGGIPAGFGTLPELEALLLGGNKFSGRLPGEVFSENSKLLRFSARANNLYGLLPRELFQNAKMLNYLDLGLNGLGGTLSPSFGDLTELKWLNLYANQFSGTIPPEFGNLVKLEEFNATNNQLSGAVPDEVCKLRDVSLASFSLDCGSLYSGESFVGAEVECSCCTTCLFG